jgi:hypothetical protein
VVTDVAATLTELNPISARSLRLEHPLLLIDVSTFVNISRNVYACQIARAAHRSSTLRRRPSGSATAGGFWENATG